MKTIRKTKIIGTIGPASDNEEMLTKLIKSGLNVCRINFSHGGYEENKEKIELIKNVREKLGKPIALCLDTKGPEIRTGVLESGDEKVVIEEGQEFTFVNEDIVGNNTKTSISYKELYKDIKPGNTLLVDDGSIEFKIKEVVGKDIKCVAMNTGKLGSRKTVNVPGVKLELPALSDKDREDLTNGVKAGFDFIFASFVRRADDVKQIRALLDQNGGQEVGIISKIESQEGVTNLDEILELSDGIMVARGDLGVEIPMEKVPIVQKRIIRKCNAAGKIVITATQMLESMISNPRPTRAEVSDVANAVYDLTGCVMLSGECAMGKYPVECVKDMDKIARTIEDDLKYWKRFDSRGYIPSENEMRANIAYSSCVTTKDIGADAIVTYTNTSQTANVLSGYRPDCPIFAITDNQKAFHKLSLAQGVTPILVLGQDSIDQTMSKGIEALEKEGIFEKGDKLVVAGGNRILPLAKENQAISGIMII